MKAAVAGSWKMADSGSHWECRTRRGYGVGMPVTDGFGNRSIATCDHFRQDSVDQESLLLMFEMRMNF